MNFGHLHFPFFGLCAAAGLVAALLLSQLTAPRVGLNPHKVWNAVMAIAIAAWVITRAVLVAGNFRFFLQRPLLLLSLATVNETGLLLTALFALACLRWNRLPLLRFLDAMAPCAALFWASLNAGYLVGGTPAGMPSRWFAAWDGVWPVEAFTLLASVIVCWSLFRSLRAARPLGRICAWGLCSAGAALFALDFLRLPSDLDGAGILDPVQWLGLTMIVTGTALVIAVPDLPAAGTSDAV